MQSKTKKTIQIKKYYYELEQVIDQYKEYIIKGLEDKIKKLVNNQKPKINPLKGLMVYEHIIHFYSLIILI